MTAGAFRGDVGGGADEHAGGGDGGVALDLGDAEVGEHHPAVLGDQHVRRLHVAVQDALTVRRAQHVQHGQADLGGAPGLQDAVLPDHLGEGLALDQFHHDPRPVVLVDHVVDRHGAVVADPCDRLGLAQGARDQAPLLLLVDVRREPQLLDGDRAAQRLVLGTPHRPHAAAAEHFSQPVPPGEETCACVLTGCPRPLRLRHASPHATRPDRAFIVSHPTSARCLGCPWHRPPSPGCATARGRAVPRARRRGGGTRAGRVPGPRGAGAGLTRRQQPADDGTTAARCRGLRAGRRRPSGRPAGAATRARPRPASRSAAPRARAGPRPSPGPAP